MSSQIDNHLPHYRVAIIGSGPSGFYAADKLLSYSTPLFEIDMFEKLPLPFGLVRYGVAPDHQKIKSVTKHFERIASHERFRFFGNVEIGKHVRIAQLRQHYHHIIYAVGAQTDRHLNLPGIDSLGSHSATEFVAWYNGHPDFRDLTFDLTQKRAAIVGMGNVAVDVARILCRTPEELAQTDIAEYALEALAKSQVEEVYLFGRRGVAQAAFSPLEIKELGQMPDAEIVVDSSNVQLDPLSQAMLKKANKDTKRNVEIVQSYAGQAKNEKSKRLYLKFLTSPTEILVDQNGRVEAIRLVKNKLIAGDKGRIWANPTDEIDVIPFGLLFRSIGYQGVPIRDVPFDSSRGTFCHHNGRIIEPATQQPKIGEYAVGWIKRGPTGVIGTNRPDAIETVELLVDDIQNGRVHHPPMGSAVEALKMVQTQQPDFVSYEDWCYLDGEEQRRGKIKGRPRIKFTSRQEVLAALKQRTSID